MLEISLLGGHASRLGNLGYDAETDLLGLGHGCTLYGSACCGQSFLMITL